MLEEKEHLGFYCGGLIRHKWLYSIIRLFILGSILVSCSLGQSTASGTGVFLTPSPIFNPFSIDFTPRSTFSLGTPFFPTIISSTIPTPYTTALPPSQASETSPIVLGLAYGISQNGEIPLPEQQWAQRLSKFTNLNIVVKIMPATEMEILKNLADGELHIAKLNPLAYVFGYQQGWVEPGVQQWWSGQEASGIMFVARKDSGLVPGEPPAVFEQLADRKACWPLVNKGLPFAPLENYLVPVGLLALQSVETIPVFIPVNLNNQTYDVDFGRLEAAVFHGKCDFAAVGAISEESYYNSWPAELANTGVTLEQWSQQMQILYTTPRIIPNPVIALSSRLPKPSRDQISEALLGTASPYPNEELRPFNASLYEQLRQIIEASKLDIETYLTKPIISSQTIDDKSVSWSSSPPGTVVVDVYLQGGPPYLPFLANSSGVLNRIVLPAIYGELVRIDTNGNYFTYLAQDLPTLKNGLVRFTGDSEDEQLEVEFRLRPGVTWQDGTPLTAEDLVFSWELVMQKAWPGSHSIGSDPAPEVYVQEVQASSPDKVVYRFMSQRQARQAAQTGGRLADPSLYANLAEQKGPVVPLNYMDVGRNVFPKHLLSDIPVGEITESEFAHHPVYAGAYRLVEGGEADKPVVLQAFTNFVLGTPSISQVVFGAIYSNPQASTYWQSPNDLMDAFQARAVQAQLGLPGINSRQGEDPGAYDALSSQGLAQVNWVGRNAWETLDFNLDNPHLSDLKVRQAIANAIDRQAIIDLALDGHGTLMRSYLPDWHPYYAGDAVLPDYNYDPQLSRSLLREAGYDLSQFPAVHPIRGALVLNLDSMDVASYPRFATAELIKKELADIGIQMNVQFYPWSDFEGQDFSAVRNSRRFDLGMAGWIGVDRFDTWYVEHVTASWSIPTTENGCPYEKANWSGWRNVRADRLIPLLEDGRLALEHPDEYQNLWIEHQQLWASELPSLPLFNWQRPVVTVPGLTGIHPSPFFSQGVEDTWNIFAWVWK
jgi:peptide/nickel transport system substrate-binding protein